MFHRVVCFVHRVVCFVHRVVRFENRLVILVHRLVLFRLPFGLCCLSFGCLVYRLVRFWPSFGSCLFITCPFESCLRVDVPDCKADLFPHAIWGIRSSRGILIVVAG